MKISVLHDNSVIKNQAVLVCGDSSEMVNVVAKLLSTEGFRNIVHESGEKPAAIVYCDGGNFNDNFMSMKGLYPEVPVVLVSVKDDVEYVVQSLKAGIYDFLPFEHIAQRLVIMLIKAIERSMLVSALGSNTKVISKLSVPEHFAHIVTQSEVMYDLFRYIEQLANTTHPVLVTGETGVGKELFARAVYNVSGKSDFVALNIAGIDAVTFSDTLFGHTKGAFTGADIARDGMLSKVKDGVLFLDEIGDLSEDNQLKLLRLIQEREYYRLGSDILHEFKGRLVLATNKDLEFLVNSGKFRRDLYFRINSHHVAIPPLRERKGDIPLLLNYFVEKASRQLVKPVPKISSAVLDLLESYAFPGNIRELESIVFDVVAQHTYGIVSVQAFYDKLEYLKMQVNTSIYEFRFNSFPSLREMSDYLVDYAMKISNQNQTVAASMLGITRQALNKRLNLRDVKK